MLDFWRQGDGEHTGVMTEGPLLYKVGGCPNDEEEFGRE